jgi:H+/Cl- antiporter ClcA
VGVGLAAAAIGATVAPYVIPTQPQQPILPPFSTNHFHPLTQSLLLSLVFGATGAVVTKGLTALIQNRGAIAGRVIQQIQGGNNNRATLSGNTQALPQSQQQNN